MAKDASNAKKDKVRSGKVEKPHQRPAAKITSLTEIDDIFAAKKNPATTTATATTTAIVLDPATPKPQSSVTVVDASSLSSASQQPQRPPPKNDDFADSRGKSSKYTEDGLRVFYMEDLRIGEGEGATDLCPFDCSCCF
ncbi:hypothetical protein GGF42_000076 [Coemansia sp. RSA 2424]|nr:hypothetical protein GGF42_000076 [Coemansia sp. RSA 2424]